jgi:hypothetical protein
MTAPRIRRIIPRADHVLRYINSIILNNLRSDVPEEDTVITLPSIVSRAYMIVNETATLEVSDLTPNYEVVVGQ